MKKTVLSLALLALLLVSGSAVADICTLDKVPAATLLLPYFEVDLDNADGVTTLFSVNNASAAPTIAHVSMWTDLSVVTIDFDLYLTGYDVVTINVRDIFNGFIPATGPANLTGASAATGEGAFSFNSIAFPGCENSFPSGGADGFLDIPASLVTLLEQAHTGVGVTRFGGNCAAVPYGDRIARGYITIDVVEACSVAFPNTPGYFTSIAGFDNQIWGDFFLVDPANAFAQGETLVHLEAGDIDDFLAGDYTFYGRYVAFTGADRREPLPSIYATRYIQNAVFDGGTNLLCWRDPKQNINSFPCGAFPPAPFPLSQTQVVIFDEDENPELVEESPISPVEEFEFAACPWETQRAIVGSDAIPASPDAGWLYLNLNHSTGAVVDPFAQAWVMPIMSASGLFSVGFDAIQLNDLCTPLGPEDNLILPVLPAV